MRLLIGIATLFAGIGQPATASDAFQAPKAALEMRVAVSKSPLNFEANLGQTNPNTDFVAHGSAFAIDLSPQGATLIRSGEQKLRMQLLGARRDAAATGESPSAARVNYLIGADPMQWKTNIPVFAKVRYTGVYEGVDLLYYGSEERLEYDFIVAAGANPRPIHLQFSGAQLKLDAAGNLSIRERGGDVVFQRPVAYQVAAGQRIPVAATYRLDGDRVRFELGKYDHRKALIIDPVLSYFSYLGGSSCNTVGFQFTETACGLGVLTNAYSGQSVAVDSSGDLYVTGHTTSTDFPTLAALPTPTKVNPSGNTAGWQWAFVSKFAPDGKSLIFSTYLGGTLGYDYGLSIALDKSGDAFIVGATDSDDFPTSAGAFQSLCAPSYQTSAFHAGCNAGAIFNTSGEMSAFITKLSPSGTLLASTFLGGTTGAIALHVAVDSTGRPYVAGVANPGVNIPVGFGGGYTPQLGFPTTAGALQTSYTYCTGCNNTVRYETQDGFVSVFDPTLKTLLYSTLFGDDQPVTPTNFYTGLTAAAAIAVDAAGNFYLTGFTQSAFLPTTAGASQAMATSCGPLDTSTAANSLVLNSYCGFVAKFSPVGGTSPPSLSYATYLGGVAGMVNGVDEITGISVDAMGDAYVVGWSNVQGFPTTRGAYEPTCSITTGGGTCGNVAFVAELNPSGSQLLHATYFGEQLPAGNPGSDVVYQTGPIAFDAAGNIYIEGVSGPQLTQVNPLSPSGGGLTNFAGAQVPFVAELDPTLSSNLFTTQLDTGGASTEGVDGLAVDSSGSIYVAATIRNTLTSSAATPGAVQSSLGAAVSGGFVAKITPTFATSTALTASPTSAPSGTAVTFTATVTESLGTGVPTGMVTFSDGPTALGSVTLNGTGVAAITNSTLAVGAHSIAAAYAGDSSNTASTSSAVSVTVSAPAALPTVAIAAAPAAITVGQSSTLTWTSANTTACTASGAWSGSEALSGTLSVAPKGAGALKYVLTCMGAGGSATASAALNVSAPAPTVTIAATPSSITVGQSATLAWSSTNAQTCTASGSWSGSEALSGTLTVTPSAAGAANYVLTCSGTSASGNATAALTVNAAAGKSGGGSMNLWQLAALALLVFWVNRRRMFAG